MVSFCVYVRFCTSILVRTRARSCIWWGETSSWQKNDGCHVERGHSIFSVKDLGSTSRLGTGITFKGEWMAFFPSSTFIILTRVCIWIYMQWWVCAWACVCENKSSEKSRAPLVLNHWCHCKCEDKYKLTVWMNPNLLRNILKLYGTVVMVKHYFAECMVGR